MQQDIRTAVEEVLAIEREADALVDRARDDARTLRANATQEAARAREQLIAEARGKAEAIVARAREEAETERRHRLEDADRQVGELERAAETRMDAAVRFAVARLLGKTDGASEEGTSGSSGSRKTG